MNNNYSHIDLVIHNRNGYGFVSFSNIFETFYNTIRIHSHCGYESPNQYENNYYSKH
ncbi:hypothetical protein [Holdemanella sp.]|uniref:hypothetical protein n=1 Tax=Holdemanella sp. TaxID=1971762 RepID=UPI0025865C40|nr:hypothetical protein [Holdemanella sp.]